MTPIAIIIAATLFAQTSSNKPADVTVQQVNDRRTNGPFSHLTLYLNLPAVHSADVAASRVLVRTAADDAGNELTGKEKEPQLEPNQRQEFAKGEATAPAMVVSIELKNPARAAKTVKEVRGDIELYMPARDPNGTATISKFLSQSGKSLSDRALKANGVDIAIITKAQFDATKKAAGEKRRAEAKAEGREGEDLEAAVTNYLDSYFTPDDGDVLLKVNDPNKRIESISYVAPGGDVKRTNMRDHDGMTVLSTYGEKPQPDWSMRINLKTAKNIVRYPFALTNVALP